MCVFVLYDDAVCRRLDDVALMALLLTRGGDVWAVDNNGWTALDHAAFGGRPRALSVLLAFVKLDKHALQRLNGGDADRRTVLHRAARSGSVPCVSALLSVGTLSAVLLACVDAHSHACCVAM